MNWNNIYHENLRRLLAAPHTTVFADTFILENPLDHQVENRESCDYEVAEVMFNWIMSGSDDISTMHALPAGKGNRARDFEIEYEGRCTAYGPRIVDQLPTVLDMLNNYPDTRRACIMILDDWDQEVATALHKHETKCEYPCTMGLTFWLEDGRLNGHTTMRSNNYTSVVCLDVYIFCNLLIRIAGLIGKPVGQYYHHVVNAHILPEQIGRAVGILDTYDKIS